MDWDYWESRQDRLCQNCLMHSGFETSAVLELRKSPRDMLRMATWNLLGIITQILTVTSSCVPAVN